MRVLTWNVKGAFPYQGEDEIEAPFEYLDGLDEKPDLLMLNEVNQYRRGLIRTLVTEMLGYEGVVDTLSWANELRNSDIPPHHDIGHTNGNLTAVRDSDRIQTPPWNSSTRRSTPKTSSICPHTIPRKSSLRRVNSVAKRLRSGTYALCRAA